MSEWWTYSPADFLLFSPQTYYRLFELHNAALWPAHIPALALGFSIPVLLHAPGPRRDRIVAAVLAACWLWVAWSFLFLRYATINWAAVFFAWLFAIEALLLLLIGVVGGRLAFGRNRIGFGLLVFALAVQPLIGPLLGREWPGVEIFGIAPDPTAVATLGILALAKHRSRWGLLVIPVLWCAISGVTLRTMGSPDALVLPTAALLAIGGMVLNRRRGKSAS